MRRKARNTATPPGSTHDKGRRAGNSNAAGREIQPNTSQRARTVDQSTAIRLGKRRVFTGGKRGVTTIGRNI